LVSKELFALEEPVAALNSRDASDFEVEWLRVHKALSELERSQPMTESARRLMKEIEEESFKTVYTVSGSTEFTKFAPAVSEDFGLLARGLCYGHRDVWLSGLLASYQQGIFPCGRIQPSEKTLDELLVQEALL